ncbi:MAG TPA: hypothetical protein VGD17_14350, partial [Chitinophagaceae bacterium]
PSYYLEQTSSEKTARFKAELVNGKLLADMTGGFGIDTYFFSEKIPDTWYIEQDPAIYEIASSNLHRLNPRITTVKGNSLEVLQQLPEKADWLYLDPIRRTKERRLSRIEEYSPNLKQIREQLFAYGRNIMIKLSPMSDISEAIRIFGDKVSHVYVLAVDNECKELLITASENDQAETIVESINWIKGQEERFVSSLHNDQHVPVSDPLNYLYEPNAAIFKAQQYDIQAALHKLKKLHANTHVYTSAELDASYAGKIYEVKDIFNFDTKEFRSGNDISSFNIKTRNFPVDAPAVAKKLGIREGGSEFLFCVRTKEGRPKIIRCSRILVN